MSPGQITWVLFLWCIRLVRGRCLQQMSICKLICCNSQSRVSNKLSRALGALLQPDAHRGTHSLKSFYCFLVHLARLMGRSCFDSSCIPDRCAGQLERCLFLCLQARNASLGEDMHLPDFCSSFLCPCVKFGGHIQSENRMCFSKTSLLQQLSTIVLRSLSAVCDNAVSSILQPELPLFH